MVAQDIFDDVLLSCDAALIRGEDSVLRAQLAGIPMIWTLYPQQEDTHLTKLAAFASLYTQSLPQTARKRGSKSKTTSTTAPYMKMSGKTGETALMSYSQAQPLEKDPFFASDFGREHFQIG